MTVDDMDEVLAVAAGIFGVAVHLADVLRNRFGERFYKALRAEHVVRRNAGLARVQALAPGNLFHGIFDVHVVEDDGGRFSTEFEREPCMDFGGAFRDMRTDVGASGKEDMVEGELEQFVPEFRSGA